MNTMISNCKAVEGQRLPSRRRIAARYDKLAATFLGFAKLAIIMLWLK